MLIFILRRLMQSLFVLLAVSLVVFFAVYAVGDPIELLVNAEASEADRQAMIRRLGLDLPVWQQYTGFLLRALQGDLGNSFVHGVPAIELIVQRIPATLELVLVAITLTIVIGIPLGLLAGLRNDKPTGRGLMAGGRLLMLDEPSLGLAPIIIQQIFDTIEQLRKEGMTIFLVEQNANQALKLADRGYVLENGRVVLEDTGDALLANEAVRSAYLGG